MSLIADRYVCSRCEGYTGLPATSKLSSRCQCPPPPAEPAFDLIPRAMFDDAARRFRERGRV